VRQAGITVCCGGILGMGEKESDRAGLLHSIGDAEPHPEKRAHQHARRGVEAAGWRDASARSADASRGLPRPADPHAGLRGCACGR